MKRRFLLFGKVLMTVCLFATTTAQAQIYMSPIGNIGFGASNSPYYKVHIFNSYYSALSIQQNGQAAWAFTVNVDSASTDFIRGLYSGSYYFQANTTGVSASAFYTISDLNSKQNVESIQSPLSKVLQLRGISYQLKPLTQATNNKYSKTRIGMIAQEVEKIVPEVVFTDEDGKKSVAYGEITALLIEAIKEQHQLIEQHQQQIDSLIADGQKVDIKQMILTE